MRILIVGFGVVGRAFATLLETNREALYQDHGLSPRLVGVVDSGGAAVSERGLEVSSLLEAKQGSGSIAAVPGYGRSGVDVESLITESDADVVIEATPSRIDAPDEAIAHLMAAFRTGRHAISVNKAPLAVAMPALSELAEHNNVQFRYSGTVGGGTPVLALARECARGDDIVRARGILNGTTNFILGRMQHDGDSFDHALAEATRLGYAESDPSTDIDGIDSATKVVIFANLVLGRSVTLDDVAISGIRDISADRISSAASRGQSVKLIGEIGDSLSVSPREVPCGSPLDVSDCLNAMTLTLRTSGDVTLVGRGAGGAETATAILRDLLDIWNVIGGDP